MRLDRPPSARPCGGNQPATGNQPSPSSMRVEPIASKIPVGFALNPGLDVRTDRPGAGREDRDNRDTWFAGQETRWRWRQTRKASCDYDASKISRGSIDCRERCDERGYGGYVADRPSAFLASTC